MASLPWLVGCRYVTEWRGRDTPRAGFYCGAGRPGSARGKGWKGRPGCSSPPTAGRWRAAPRTAPSSCEAADTSKEIRQIKPPKRPAQDSVVLIFGGAPDDRWSRTQFWQFAGFFTDLAPRRPNEPGLARGEIKFPGQEKVVRARFLDGKEP
ncbi:MAG TPA: hypothetical protein VFA26_22810 [Gemmataceae bacterium]|nr:hypothetical protein [Gemmataceae bacterium]